MGKPTASAVSSPEFIGCGGDTRGTETSKYPEEKKSTEIPLVAASERGAADKQSSSGTFWKVGRYRVIVPYMKLLCLHIK